MNAERLRQAPISGKLRITIFLACAAALFAATAAMFAVQYGLFHRDFWRAVDVATEIAADSLADPILRNQPDEARSVLQMLENQPHAISARIVLNDGTVFAESGVFVAFDVSEQPIVSAGETFGVLRVHTDFTSQVVKLLGLHTVLFVVAVGIAFLVAIPVSARLFRSIFDPIKTLGETAREIAAKDDYSLRAVKTGEDEVGAFTDTFNSLLAQIQARDQELRHEIAERVRAEREIQRIHEQLMEASRQAGMAEVATGVLHNVGNVLNSVNVSATVVAELLDPDRAANLVRAANLLREQDAGKLADFLSRDPRGKVLPAYLAEVSAQFAAERDEAVAELASLRKNIDHIKDIVATQQSNARIAGMVEPADLAALIDDALRMTRASLDGSEITIVRNFTDVPLAMADRHQTLQIFVNLIRNAKDALEGIDAADRRLSISLRSQDGRYVQAAFADTGSGIAAENLTRIFSHGFTTRARGHGFGLHSAALAAQAMAGCLSAQSDGLGKGATFIVELPIADATSTSA